MKDLGHIALALFLSTAASAVEVGGRVSLDNYYFLNSGGYTFGRLQGEATLKHSFTVGTGSLDLNLEGRGWGLYDKYGVLTTGPGSLPQDTHELAPRNAHISYLNGPWTLRAGYQILSWGETFGIPPTDLVNPRDFRNYDFLDSPRNKLAIPLATVSHFFGNGSIQAGVSPKRNAPRLFLSANGIPIDATRMKDGWFEGAEGGA